MSSDSSDPFSGFPEAPRSATSDIPSDPSPFRSWAFIIVHLLSSAFLLLFVFWTLMTYRALEAMRSREASSAHLLIVFDQPPPKKEIAGLQATLEKIVGTGNVSPMSVQAGQGPTERRTRQRVLSVLLAPGQDAAGRPVLLADMIRSISQVVHNDARIQDVVYSPDWISRVDSLMFLSLGIRKGLLLVGALAAVSLSLYWGLMGPPLFNRLRQLSRSGELSSGSGRTSMFGQETSPSKDLPLRSRMEESLPVSFGLRSFGGAALGGISALIVLLLSWSLKSVLFPSTFPSPLSLGLLHEGPLLLVFVLGSFGAGLLGGALAALISPKEQRTGDPLR